MLTRSTPETLATEITVNGQGHAPIKLNVTFHNRTQDQVNDKLLEAVKHEKAQSDMQYANRAVLLYVIKDMESEYPLTDDGMREMESDRPGMIEGLFSAFHRSRRVEVVKN
jgi:hypothetical protein